MNPIEALEAAGLKPIVIDEDTDIGAALETNEDFMVRIMNFGCPTGGLIQPFIIEALASYCDDVLNIEAGSWPENSFITLEVWQATAKWLNSELEKKYGKA